LENTEDFLRAKKEGKKIVMLSCYDYPSALIAEKVGIDSILVGDSLAMCLLGYESTLSVGMEEMLIFCKAVARGLKKTFLVADMPFLSYQVSLERALENAGKFIKEGNAKAVKLEGGKEICPLVKNLVASGIPVMGHIGLLPQYSYLKGGFKFKGREAKEALKLVKDALALEEAGVFAIVLEAISSEVAKIITERLTIPTIGIGSGAYCDGQILVYHDLLGLFERFKPKYVKQYVNLSQIIFEALEKYKEEVIQNLYPDYEHSYHMSQEEYQKFLDLLKNEL